MTVTMVWAPNLTRSGDDERLQLRPFNFSQLFELEVKLTSYPEEPRYDRDRSASPRPAQRDDNYRNDRNGRNRSASPGGRMNSRYAFML